MKDQLKYIVLVLLLACGLSGTAQTSVYRAQQELVGSKVWKLGFTDWLKNQPADTSFKGKYKVLEFWATWCKPCLEAVPHLNKLQREFEDSVIVFLSVTDETPEKTARILDKINFETIVVSDRNRFVHRSLRIEYNGTMGLPRTVILDPDNNILWYGSPKALSKKVLNELMKKHER